MYKLENESDKLNFLSVYIYVAFVAYNCTKYKHEINKNVNIMNCFGTVI